MYFKHTPDLSNTISRYKNLHTDAKSNIVITSTNIFEALYFFKKRYKTLYFLHNFLRNSQPIKRGYFETSVRVKLILETKVNRYLANFL